MSSGMAYLFNTASKTSKNTNDLVQFKSISDPHYLLTNLIPPKYEEHVHSTTILDFKFMEMPSQTILMLMTSNWELLLYKHVIA